MGKDEYNPFAALKKVKFSQKGDEQVKKPSKTKLDSSESEVFSGDDDAMFMRAMAGVTTTTSGKDNAQRIGKKSAEQAAFDDGPAKMDEIEAFKNVKKLTKKKIKRSHEESQARDRSREAVASAPVKEEKSEEMAFFAAMQGVDQLSAKGGRDIAPEVKPREPVESGIDPAKALQDLLDGNVEFCLEYTEEYIQGHVEGLDPITMGKLRAGKYSPEGHLDMHGMTAAQAYDAMVMFMRAAYNKGKRTVLIIPGRGKNSPEGISILRERVQGWLTHDPFKRVVLAFCTAQAKDGGAGAVYVLLRKHKKKHGKIHWDKLPNDAHM